MPTSTEAVRHLAADAAERFADLAGFLANGGPLPEDLAGRVVEGLVLIVAELIRLDVVIGRAGPNTYEEQG